MSEQEIANFLAEVNGEEMSHYHDLEPDIFNFNINGRVGQFIFAPGDNNDFANEISKEVLLIPYQNLKVTYEIIDETEGINKFTITDENGVKYLFESERKKPIRKMKTIANEKRRDHAHQFNNLISSQAYTSAWFLTK
ncbi:MAG: hypothetical protein U5Q03_18105 [Bacteroidota bacterium]|nr:hypothetical protein [Bacteroidota bacterium]